MTSTSPSSHLFSARQFKPMNSYAAPVNIIRQPQHHFPAKINPNHMFTESDRLKMLCCVQLRRLFTDFWSKDSKLTVLIELLSQKNIVVLAILREHIKHLIYCIERTPNARVLVPLFKSAAEGDIALSKAHLSHVKLLFYYVCLAGRTCVDACSGPAVKEKQQHQFEIGRQVDV